MPTAPHLRTAGAGEPPHAGTTANDETYPSVRSAQRLARVTLLAPALAGELWPTGWLLVKGVRVGRGQTGGA